MKKPSAIESMTRVEVGSITVRVWRTEPEVKEKYDNTDIQTAVRNNARSQFNKLAKVVSELPRVSAYEILDSKGNGVVVYNDWP